MNDTQQKIQWGKDVISIEISALELCRSRLSEDFAKACELILSRDGKVICTGLGKSGHVARKISATLSSTGTSSAFIHPSEALHGDSGMLQSQDVLVAIAYGGETKEVLELCKIAKRSEIPIVSITGKLDSSLAEISDLTIDGAVNKEADSLNLAPTASSSVAMAIGDALAVTLMRSRGFCESDFARFHPAGKLGKKLSHVEDHMHHIDELSKLAPKDEFEKIMAAAASHNFGIIPVTDESGRLVGSISDGDLRRAFARFGREEIFSIKAEDIMTNSPKTVSKKELAIDAFAKMDLGEGRGITQLFVVSEDNSHTLVGLLRLHDLLSAKIL